MADSPILWSIVFIVSIAVLSKSSDYFVTSSEKIGVHFNLPQFITGAIIVALGTSLPELAASIASVIYDTSEIVIGNVIGSNITNIFLILGVTGILGRNFKRSFEILKVDMPLLAVSALLLAITIWDQHFSIFEGIIFILGMILYITYSLSSDDIHKPFPLEGDLEEKEAEEYKERLPWTIWLWLVLSGVGIYFGATYTVESITKLSGMLMIGSEIIAVTAVALGTSLPELAVSITAARKNNPEMAVGNVLGSNIFNTFSVVGIASLFGSLTIPASILEFSLPMMLIATVIFLFMSLENQFTKWEGWALLLLYVYFIGQIIQSQL